MSRASDGDDMTEPKTIRVKRAQKSFDPAHDERATPTPGYYLQRAGCLLASVDLSLLASVDLTGVDAEELDITITPVKSIKQRRREARRKAMREKDMTPYEIDLAMEAVERADAEFDREREAEVRGKLRVALEDFWRLRLRAYEDGIPSRMKLAYESAREAIEAIYRGER